MRGPFIYLNIKKGSRGRFQVIAHVIIQVIINDIRSVIEIRIFFVKFIKIKIFVIFIQIIIRILAIRILAF